MLATRFHWTTERDQMILIVVSSAELQLPYQSADRSLLPRFVLIRRQPPSATRVSYNVESPYLRHDNDYLTTLAELLP